MSFMSASKMSSEPDTSSSRSTFSYNQDYEKNIEYLESMIDDNATNDTYKKLLAEQISAFKSKITYVAPSIEESCIDEFCMEEDDLDIEEKTRSELEENMYEMNKPFRNLLLSLKHLPRLEDVSETSIHKPASTVSESDQVIRWSIDPIDKGVSGWISEVKSEDEVKSVSVQEDDGEKQEDKGYKDEEKDEVKEEEEEQAEEEEEEEEWPFLASSSSTSHLEEIDEVDELFDTLLNAYVPSSVEFDKPILGIRLLNERKELSIFIDKLFTEVLDIVVVFCEDRADVQRLKNKLDKNKLMTEIQEQLLFYLTENSFNHLVNRKVVEFYRRKKFLKPISLTNVDNSPENIKRRKNAYQALNKLMGKEKYAQETFKRENDRYTNTFLAKRNQVNEEIKSFEELVEKSLCREQFKYLPTSVQVKLRKMAEYRNEISKDRVKLLLRQHTMSILLKRSNKKEFIGNNLKLKDYMELETEVKTMEDKLSERIEDIGKLQFRFYNDTNIFSHLKCCKNMVQTKYDLKLKQLQDYYCDFRNMRANLSTLERERAEMRQKKIKLTLKGGLLDKTSLMHDFDQLVLDIKEKQHSIDEMKKKYSKIVESVENLETIAS